MSATFWQWLTRSLFQHPVSNPSSGLNPSDFDSIAIVDEPIYPYQLGRVQFRCSWWPARCLQETVISPGQLVRVIGQHNITLLVEPTRFPVRDKTRQSQSE
jgi:membrane protein implicated in regulation of membrane protease activity